MISAVNADDSLDVNGNSVAQISNDGSFYDLFTAIDDTENEGVLYLNNSIYKVDASAAGFIPIEKNITINGGSQDNGGYSTVDADKLCRIFVIRGNNAVTLINIHFINSNDESIPAILNDASLTVINCTFENNTGSYGNDVLNLNGAIANIINSTFKGPSAKWGSVYVMGGEVNVINSTFKDIESKYSSGIYVGEDAYLVVDGCKFENSIANETAGAIGAKKSNGILIQNTIFNNTWSVKNAGGLYVDTVQQLIVSNTVFENCLSEFGGATLILNSKDVIFDKCLFNSNGALFDGGALYSSFSKIMVLNTNFTENIGMFTGERGSKGGAIYVDASFISLENCSFVNNTATGEAGAIYAYQCNLSLDNIVFDNSLGLNGSTLYEVFPEGLTINNVSSTTGFSLNNTNYATIFISNQTSFAIVDNDISLSILPKRFDLRDFGWVSPVKNQGSMGACWAFSVMGTLESAFLKFTNTLYDFSENNLQDSMLQYSNIGVMGMFEGGDPMVGADYLISWIGPVINSTDSYDELGKISPVFIGDLHIQNVVQVPGIKNASNIDHVKEAILKYGGLAVSYYADQTDDSYNSNTSAFYYSGNLTANHAVVIVGWDDTYSAENFVTAPAGDGAWIVKNSWGTSWGDGGYFYASYYSTMFGYDDLIGFKITNESYNVNYQHEIGGQLTYSDDAYSAVQFEALRNDLISAFGTFFNQDEAYEVKVYVNDVLKYTQEGTASFSGYNTISLDTKIPVSIGDIFRVELKQNDTPMEIYSRVILPKNASFTSNDGVNWVDSSDEQNTKGVPVLKVYAEASSIIAEDLVKYYKNESKFEVIVNDGDGQGVANKTVTFTINGGDYNRTTDENGVARFAINLGPGVYNITTTYVGKSIVNTVTVLSTIIADNLVKYFQNDSQFYAQLVDGNGVPVEGKVLTFNINGVFYNRTTNASGFVKLNINLAPATYILTAIDPLNGLMQSFNITVLPRIIGENVEMNFQDGSKYSAKLVSATGAPLKGEKVTLNINGVLYDRTTDDNGCVFLNINLMQGIYIITAYYQNEATSNYVWVK